MRVVLTSRARSDLREIYAYLQQRSPEGAENVFHRFRAAFLLLRDQPEIGAKTSEGTVRRIYVGRYPYLAYYRIRLSKVEILHVRHTSRSEPESDELS